MYRSMIALVVAVWFVAGAERLHADQPRFGVDGQFIASPVQDRLKGFRIDSVYSCSVADDAGLERGDIIVYIDSYGFQNSAAFDWALTQVGRTARVGVINVRNGKLEWVTCRFNHRPHRGTPRPRGIAIVDFGFVGVVTIYNHTGSRIHYQLRYKTEANDRWSPWRAYTHRYPNGGWHYHTFPQAREIEIRYDRDGGHGVSWKTYSLDFNRRAGNSNVGRDSGVPYAFSYNGEWLRFYSEGR